MSANPVPIAFPLGGIAEIARYGQSPGKAVVRPDQVLNVRAHDAIERRARGGQRTGISRFIDQQIGDGGRLQNLAQFIEAVALEVDAAWGDKRGNPSGGNTDDGEVVAVHPDGAWVVVKTGGSSSNLLEVYAWDDATGFGSRNQSFDPSASLWDIADLQFSPDGQHLLVGARDDARDTLGVYTFDAANGEITGLVDSVLLPTSGSGAATVQIGWHPDAGWVGYSCSSHTDSVNAGFVILLTFDGTSLTQQEHLGAGGDAVPDLSTLDSAWTWTANGNFIILAAEDPDDGTRARLVSLAFSTSTGVGSQASTQTVTVGGGSFTQSNRHLLLRPVGDWVAVAHNNSSFGNPQGWITCPIDDSAGSLGTPSFDEISGMVHENRPAFSPSGDVLVAGGGTDALANVFTASGLGSALTPPSAADGTILCTAAKDGVFFFAVATGVALNAYDFQQPETNPAARQSRLIAVAGGSVFRTGSPPESFASVSGGSDVFTVANPVDSSQLGQRLFFCSGGVGEYHYYDATDGALHDWSSDITAGALPTDSDNNTCRIIATYRGRIVLAGLLGEPQNWFMSRVLDPFDWDFSPATTSSTQAVAGNASEAGQPADIITALIPHQDDILFIGGANSLWVMRGDPAAGGAIDNVSREVGVVGPNAWAQDEGGVIYFLSRNGMYRMAQGAAPEPVSRQKLDKTFGDIDYSNQTVDMVYDSVWLGVHIFITPVEQPTEPTDHFFWDQRTNSFWRDQYPVSVGPTAVVNFRGDTEATRGVLLGGFDGRVRLFDDDAMDDDGTPIESYCRFPLMHPGLPMGQFQMRELQVTLGDGAMGHTAYFDILRGDTPRQAADAETAVATKLLQPGRNVPMRKNVRANALAFRIRSNDNGEPWAYEAGTVLVGGVGRLRKRVSA